MKFVKQKVKNIFNFLFLSGASGILEVEKCCLFCQEWTTFYWTSYEVLLRVWSYYDHIWARADFDLISYRHIRC